MNSIKLFTISKDFTAKSLLHFLCLVLVKGMNGQPSPFHGEIGFLYIARQRLHIRTEAYCKDGRIHFALIRLISKTQTIRNYFQHFSWWNCVSLYVIFERLPNKVCLSAKWNNNWHRIYCRYLVFIRIYYYYFVCLHFTDDINVTILIWFCFYFVFHLGFSNGIGVHLMQLIVNFLNSAQYANGEYFFLQPTAMVLSSMFMC